MNKRIYLLLLMLPWTLFLTACTDSEVLEARRSVMSVLSSESVEVKLIKAGHFEMDSSISVGTAFDRFFNNPKWVIGLNDSSKVTFYGGCTYLGKPAEAQIEFRVNKSESSFVVESIYVNNEQFSPWFGNLFLATIVDSAKTNN